MVFGQSGYYQENLPFSGQRKVTSVFIPEIGLEYHPRSVHVSEYQALFV